MVSSCSASSSTRSYLTLPHAVGQGLPNKAFACAKHNKRSADCTGLCLCTRHSVFMYKTLEKTTQRFCICVVARFAGYPMQQNSIYCHLYFYVAFGHHLATLIYILKSPCLPDFFDQLLPCVAALCLIYFSYMSNFLRVGVVILLCHDICDIFTFGCVFGRKRSQQTVSTASGLHSQMKIERLTCLLFPAVFYLTQCGVCAQVQGVCRHAVS